jgi:UDP-N-acetylglucosamine 2-epimerase
MQIKDYITKNLPSLNWNILPQIFEENGVEMNEEIEAYLKETPGNTNWNVFEEILEAAEDREDRPMVVTVNFNNSGEDSSDIYVTNNGTDLGFTSVFYDETEQSLFWGEWVIASDSGYSESELQTIGQAVLTALRGTDKSDIIDAIRNNGSLNLVLEH